MIHCYKRTGKVFEAGYYTPAEEWVSKMKGLATEEKAAKYVYYLEWGRPTNLPLSKELITEARRE